MQQESGAITKDRKPPEKQPPAPATESSPMTLEERLRLSNSIPRNDELADTFTVSPDVAGAEESEGATR